MQKLKKQKRINVEMLKKLRRKKQISRNVKMQSFKTGNIEKQKSRQIEM